MANQTTPAIQIKDSNVGIGTTAPVVKTHIVGPTLTTNNETTYPLWLSDTGDTTKSLILGFDLANDVGVIQAVDQAVGWKSVSLTPTAGNVLIGTTTDPGYKLFVNGSIVNNTNINSTGDAGLLITPGLRLGFDESGVRSWNVKATGGNLAFNSGDGNGSFTFGASVTASSLIKSGGTSSQYLMADGSVSTIQTANVYTQTFFIPDTAGTAQWVKVGTWTAAQGGQVVTVEIAGHAGYNATTGQNQSVYIYMKTSNGSSVDPNGFAADSSFYTQGLNATIGAGNVIWEANAAGVSATAYTLYVLFGQFTNGSQYTVTSRGGTWANVGTLTAPSGTTSSSTILLSEFRYSANNQLLTLDGNSSVLIGTTTNSGYKLDVNGTARIVGNFTTNGEQGIELGWTGSTINDQRIGRIRPISTSAQNPYAGGLAFDYYKYDGASYNFFEGMRLNGAGQLLINATSSAYGPPLNYGYNLGVKGIAGQAFISIARSTQTLDSEGLAIGVDTGEGAIYLRDNLPLSIYTNNTFAMRIAAGGNVLIGTTTDSGYKLRVSGQGYFDSVVTMYTGFTSYTTDGLFSANALYGSVFTPSGNSRIRLGYFDQGGGQYWGRIGFNGSTNWNIGTAAGGESFQIGIGNDSSAALLINNAGQVGIGTTNPTAQLQVNGNFRLYTTNNDGNELRGIFNVGGTADPLSFSMYKADATTVGTFLTADGASYFVGGNVGIGTTSPGGQLSIFDTNNSRAYQMSFGYETTETFRLGNNNATGKFTFTQLNNNNGFRFTSVAPNSTGIIFDINTTQLAVNGDTGNVGIGTSSPQDKLEIKSGFLRMYDPSSTINAGYLLQWSSDNGGTNVTYAGIDAITTSAGARTGDLRFLTSSAGSPTEKMRITSGGNVLIGTTTDNGRRLNVSGDIFASGEFYSNQYAAGRYIRYNWNTTNFVVGASTATRWVIGRIYWNQIHWGNYSGMDIEIVWNYYNGARKKYTISNGAGGGGIYLRQSQSYGSAYALVSLGSAVDTGTTSGGYSNYYQDVYLDVTEYNQVSVNGELKGPQISIDKTSIGGGEYGWATFFSSPTSSNISTFTNTAATILTSENNWGYIDNRLGINVANPDYQLDVYSANTPVVRIQSQNSSGVGNPRLLMSRGGEDTFQINVEPNVGVNFKAVVADAGYMDFYTGTNAVTMRLSSSKNVLIGTTTDNGYKLYVNGTGFFNNVLRASAANTFPIRAIATSGGVSRISFEDNVNQANDAVWVGSEGYNLCFGSNFSEQARISSSGNLIIGSTTDAGYKLDVYGEILGRDDIRILNTYALILNGTDANWRIGRNTITDTGWLTGNTMQMVVFGGQTGQGFQVVNTNGTALFEIDGVAGASRFTNALGVGVNPSGTAGRIDASNDIVAYSTSDQRLKENITPIANALDKVKALTGVEFDWKEDTKAVHGYEGHDVGVIAQEVQAVLPEAVRTNDSGYLSVRYEKMIALLVEANKELASRVEELEKKLK